MFWKSVEFDVGEEVGVWKITNDGDSLGTITDSDADIMVKNVGLCVGVAVDGEFEGKKVVEGCGYDVGLKVGSFVGCKLGRIVMLVVADFDGVEVEENKAIYCKLFPISLGSSPILFADPISNVPHILNPKHFIDESAIITQL